MGKKAVVKKNKATAGGAPGEMTLEELRHSPDRAVFVEGKGWNDKWMAKQMGRKDCYIVPVELEKHGNRAEAEGIAAKQGELLPAFFLASLFDYDKGCMVPAAVKMGFKSNDWYWAKEVVAGNPGCARMVSLGYGGVGTYDKGLSNYVRCVRLSQRLTKRHILLPEYLPVLSRVPKEQAHDGQRPEI